MDPTVVTQRVIREWPPNIVKILDAFPRAAVTPGVIFAFGDVIYAPRLAKDEELPRHIMGHEYIHQQQMERRDPLDWWEQYCKDPRFRLEMEIPAHCMEYSLWCQDNPTNRNMRRAGLKLMAQRLSGPLYGNLLPFDMAKRIIKNKEVK